MALLFSDASTDRVDIGSNASLDNLATGTMIAWCFPVTPGGADVISGKAPAGFGAYREFAIASANLRLSFILNRATTDLNAFSGNNVITAGQWNYYGCVWDVGGANGDQKLFVGDLTTIVAEIGSYTIQTVGAGAQSDDSGSSQGIGNYVEEAGSNFSFEGDIAFFAIWNRVLTLGELRAQQFRPHVTNGCVGFYHLGFNGTGTQADWSGNGNSGSVTGATTSDHVPLGPPFGFSDVNPYEVAVVGNPLNYGSLGLTGVGI